MILIYEEAENNLDMRTTMSRGDYHNTGYLTTEYICT